ncbi:MAG: YebC/PmpR family DNA-binding transcriptional regulator [Anaerolineales bacterium]|nr:YebC/PmpR family DNA-binding transcriptional regulator [Anaerolineales bacterium]
MSGHSKWSTIKHKKAAVDAKRGKIFTRLAKEITIAAREGDANPEFNPALRLAIDKAKKANMPNDNIDRAIKRGTGELDGGELFEIVYEGYGSHGVGILIECVTDNKNRAVAEIRHTLNKHGGNMATAGAVSWQFTQKGYFATSQKVDQDEFFMLVADAGAEDVQFSDDLAEVFAEKDLFNEVRSAIQDEGIELEEANLIYDPNNPMDLSAGESLQVMKLIEALEDLDDVQNVYSVLNISDEAIAAMEG